MQVDHTLSRIFLNLAQALQNNHIEFSIAGAFAVSLYTQPRATSDIDLVAFIDHESRQKIISILDQHFTLLLSNQEAMPMRFFEIWRHIIKPDAESPMVIPIDFISIPEDFLASTLRRSVVLPVEGIYIRFVSKEDLIIMKLDSSRAKDIDDIERLICEPGEIDYDYIKAWAERFSLHTDVIDTKRNK